MIFKSKKWIPIILCIILVGYSFADIIIFGTLCTKKRNLYDWDPGVLDVTLRLMIDTYIPTNDCHSTLLILTECFGGDVMDNFSTRANTTVLSATSPGQTAEYGGYDDDAARALRAAPGWNSDSVHAAGIAGKDPSETPVRIGPVFSLEPTNPSGPIQERFILIYAGRPDGKSDVYSDSAYRDTIIANFSDDIYSTVITVGGEGPADNWNYEGTRIGLIQALNFIGNNMSSNVQFIMYVTDHGSRMPFDDDPGNDGDNWFSDCIGVGSDFYDMMLACPTNNPAIYLFSGGSTQPEPVDVHYGEIPVLYTLAFDYSVDINNDGDLDDEGEGWIALQGIPEEYINAECEIITVQVGEGLNLEGIGLSVGAIAKLPWEYAYVLGDVNMYNGQWPPQVIGSDVTYLVNYFRGLPENLPCILGNLFCAADVNGDCQVIGSDVTKLVNYFRDSTDLQNCPYYTPVWSLPGLFPEIPPAGWPNCETAAAGRTIPSGAGK